MLQFVAAVKAGDIEQAKKEIKRVKNPNDHKEVIQIICEAWNPNLELFKLLLDAGVNPTVGSLPPKLILCPVVAAGHGDRRMPLLVVLRAFDTVMSEGA